MTTRRFIPAIAVACLLFLGCDRGATALLSPNGPSRITYGSLDGNAHPAVVLILMDVAGSPAFRCSGTLIAPTAECSGWIARTCWIS